LIFFLVLNYFLSEEYYLLGYNSDISEKYVSIFMDKDLKK
jgi:hypothetical protein